MGKGGQKTAAAPAEASAPITKVNVGPMKLDHLHTEELKKWAKAYGVNAEAERDQLLSALVNSGNLRKRTPCEPVSQVLASPILFLCNTTFFFTAII